MISSCTDANGPSVTLGVEVYKKGLDEALKRGLKLRLITEINESNLKYCKELAKISELRHLEGIRSNFSRPLSTTFDGMQYTNASNSNSKLTGDINE